MNHYLLLSICLNESTYNTRCITIGGLNVDHPIRILVFVVVIVSMENGYIGADND